MIRSIWPSFENLPNTMPASSGTNTRDFVSFFLFWLVSLPAIWVRAIVLLPMEEC